MKRFLLRIRAVLRRGILPLLAVAALEAVYLLTLGLAIQPTSASAGDSIEVKNNGKEEESKDKSEAEESDKDADAAGARKGEEYLEEVFPGARVDPESSNAGPSLVEPEGGPQSSALEEIIPFQLIPVDKDVNAFRLGSGGRDKPTYFEWKRIEEGILGLAPTVPAPPTLEEKPAPPAVKPEEKPEIPEEAPEAPGKKPVEEVPVKIEFPPLNELPPTEDAVTLAMKVGAEGLGRDYARVIVTSGRLSGSTKSKSYDIEGELVLFYRDIAASATRAHMDEKSEVVRLSEDALVKDPNYELSAELIEIKFKDKSFSAQNFVQFKKKQKGNEPTGKDIPKRQRVINIFKNEPTEIYANRLTYNWETEGMEVEGEVKVLQEDFTATMDKLSYNPRSKTYLMNGNVFLTLHSADWILEHEIAEKEDEDLAKALSEKESVLKANSVETGEETEITLIRGTPTEPSELSQSDKRLRALQIQIDDRNKLMTAQGSVEFYQETGDWLIKGGIVEEGAEEKVKERLAKPITSTSDFLTYDYDKRILKQWGGVKLLGENEAIFADELIFSEKEKLLTLKGNLTYYRGEEDYLFADEVVIDTGKNVMRFTGAISALMVGEETKGEEEETKVEEGAEQTQPQEEVEGEPSPPPSPGP